MSTFSKIAGINLLVLVAYTILIHITGGGHGNASLGIMLVSSVVIGLHVILCLIISGLESANSERKESAKAWLWSALIVLLVGFSVCWGSAGV